MDDSSLGIWFSCLGSGFGGRRGRNLGIGLFEEEEEEEEESESLRISSTVRRVVRSVWLSSSSSLLLVVWDWRKESRSSSVGVLVSNFVMAEFSFLVTWRRGCRFKMVDLRAGESLERVAEESGDRPEI